MINLELNISNLKDTLESCDDIVFQPIHLNNIKGCLIYIPEIVGDHLLSKIEHGLSTYPIETGDNSIDAISTFLRSRFPFSRINQFPENKNQIVNHILSGYTVLMIQGTEHVYIFDTSNYEGRKIKEPVTEQVVRGPREGFVEDISKNLMLIRKKLRNPSLKVKYVTLGKQTQTKIAVVYLEGIANEGIVDEVHKRLSRIDIDGVLESRDVESMIQDSPLSPFPTLFNTERPDRICAGLLEGKVAILTDGTPFALSAPAVFVEFLQSNEDHYEASFVASTIRWIRALGFFIALILPAFFVAITTIHQDLLQTPFLLRIASFREDLPYPIIVESFFMLLTFELAREAGLRMPRTFGNATITILGIILIGQAAVQAGLIGALMVVVISVTAITTFVLPNYTFQQVIRYLGVPMLFLGGIFGFMGIIVGLMFVLVHLSSLRSFGVPYLSPITPAHKEGWKDVFMRAPRWAMETRTPGMGVNDMARADDADPPKPPHQTKEENRDEK
jgi:hypothetical protein